MLIMTVLALVKFSKHLAVQMSNVSSELNAHGISQIVEVFDGNPRNFRDWIKQIENIVN